MEHFPVLSQNYRILLIFLNLNLKVTNSLALQISNNFWEDFLDTLTDMFFIKFLAALPVLLSFSLALPSPAEPVPRSTCTVWPTNLQYIYEASPNTVYPNDLNIFQIQQEYDPSKGSSHA
jgi:hypothetical protein